MSIEITPEIQAVIDEAVAGLQAKNSELLGKLVKAQKGQEIDPQTVIDLEQKIDKLQSDLSVAQKAAKEAGKLNETLAQKAKAEEDYAQRLLVETNITNALVASNVAPAFLDAARALFERQTKIVVDGESRVAKIGDVNVVDHIKEWAASEVGQNFVSAPANSGGGSQGGKNSQTGQKTVTREAFEGMSQVQRMEFAKTGGAIVE